MTTLFDERERAAEYGFAHAEKLRFLAAREGVERLGAWAAAQMGLEDGDYPATLVASVLGGTSQNELVARVQDDLRRAGKTAAAGDVSPMLARLTSEAYAKLHDIHDPAKPDAPPLSVPHPPDHHRHGFWGWEV